MWLLEFKSSFFCRCLVVFPFLLAMPLVSSTPDTGPMMTRGRWCVTVCCVVWLREGKVGVEGGSGRPEFKFIINSVKLNFVAWDTETHWLLWEWKICNAANKKAKLLTLAIELDTSLVLRPCGDGEKRSWYTLFAHVPSSLGNLHTTKIIGNFIVLAERLTSFLGWRGSLGMRLHITSQKCVSTIVHIYHLHNTLLVLASGQWLWAAKYSPGYPGNRHGLAHHLLQGGSWGKERSGE